MSTRPLFLFVLSALLVSAGPTAFADLIEDFDGPLAPATSNQAGSAPGPQVLSGGPTGDYLRLINNVNSQSNYYTFDATDLGSHSQVNAQFNFNGFTTGAGSAADGFSIAFLPTATYGTSGVGPTYTAEVPNVAGTLAVAFDVYNNINDMRLHYNGAEIIGVAVNPADVGFSNGEFNAANVNWRNSGTGGAVTVELTGDLAGSPTTVTPLINYYVPGAMVYENRVQFAGRTGGAFMEVNIDNIAATYSNPVTTDAVASIATQNFDGGGTNFITTRDGSGTPPGLFSGPTGNFLRLIHDGQGSQQNAIVFDANPVQGGNISGSFDFRVSSPNDAPADGFSLALLPTSQYGTTGPAPLWTGEEPNIPNAFAIGFDLHPAPGQNSVSLHFNGSQIAEVNLDPLADIDLDNGLFNRATFSLTEADNGDIFADVSLVEDSLGTPGGELVVFDDVLIPGMTLEDFRAAFRGRTGGLNMSVDLDNISISSSVPEPASLAAWGLLGLAGFLYRRARKA